MSDIDPSKFKVVEYTPELYELCKFFDFVWYFDAKQPWSITYTSGAGYHIFEGTIYWDNGPLAKLGLKTLGLNQAEYDRVMKIKHSKDFDTKIEGFLNE